MAAWDREWILIAVGWGLVAAVLLALLLGPALIDPHHSGPPPYSACKSQVRNLWLVLWLYRDEYGVLPHEFPAGDRRPDRSALLCPSRYEGQKGEPPEPPPTGWGDTVDTAVLHAAADKGRTVPILWDLPDNHPDGTVTVLFSDWQVRRLSAEESPTVVKPWAREREAERRRRQQAAAERTWHGHLAHVARDVVCTTPDRTARPAVTLRAEEPPAVAASTSRDLRQRRRRNGGASRRALPPRRGRGCPGVASMKSTLLRQGYGGQVMSICRQAGFVFSVQGRRATMAARSAHACHGSRR